MAVLITGGAGYIGSHAAVEFLNDEREIIILVNAVITSRSDGMSASIASRNSKSSALDDSSALPDSTDTFIAGAALA